MTQDQIQTKFEELEQYDYVDGEHIEAVKDKYAPLIGQLLISFSGLEQCLNYEIAERISSSAHSEGYVIIEKLKIRNKIELFHSLYLSLLFYYQKSEKLKQRLTAIKKQLEDANNFRNLVAHANWISLTKDYFVRSKIMVDNEDGFVKFKKVKMTPTLINRNINKIEALVNRIETFTSDVEDLMNS